MGVKKVKAFHLNDSKNPLGSRVDRHEGIDHIVVARKKKNLCGMRFSKSNPEGVLRSAAVGIPIARTAYPLNESPTDARFLPLREGTDRAGLLDDNASPAAADVIAANDPLFVVDL